MDEQEVPPLSEDCRTSPSKLLAITGDITKMVITSRVAVSSSL